MMGEKERRRSGFEKDSGREDGETQGCEGQDGGGRGGGGGRRIKILQRVFICSQHLLSDQYF